jgi:hypothetical protein
MRKGLGENLILKNQRQKMSLDCPVNKGKFTNYATTVTSNQEHIGINLYDKKITVV